MWRKQPEEKASPYTGPGAPERSPVTPLEPPAPASPTILPERPASAAAALAGEAAILTRGIQIKGDVTGKAELVIDGEVEGSIRLSESRVTVGPSGRVRAEVEALEIAVRGFVEGNLRARERILLGSSSRVTGNLEAARIVIEEGARFNGRVEMGKLSEARSSRPERTKTEAAPAKPPAERPGEVATRP